MKKWTFIHAEGHKVIFASPEVVDLVRGTLKRRQAEIIDEQMERDAAWVDNPGMCLVNRAIWSGEVDGLTVEIPASDFHDFLRQMKENVGNPAFNSDKDPDRGYRSVYGWLHCLALTQDQYEKLLSLMVNDSDRVQGLADEENDRFVKAISRANEEMRAAGVGVEVRSMKADLLNHPKPIGGGEWN